MNAVYRNDKVKLYMSPYESQGFSSKKVSLPALCSRQHSNLLVTHPTTEGLLCWVWRRLVVGVVPSFLCQHLLAVKNSYSLKEDITVQNIPKTSNLEVALQNMLYVVRNHWQPIEVQMSIC